MIRKFTPLVVALLVVASAAAPASAAFGLGDDEPSLDIAQRHGQPSFIVSYANESLPDLEDWANESTDRHLVTANNETRTATVAAPRVEVNSGFLTRVLSIRSLDDLDRIRSTDLLSSAGYVEDLQPNYKHTYAEPIRFLDNSSNASIPQQGAFAFDDPEYPLDGVAYDGDANTTYMSDSREILGADNVSSGIDGSGVLVANIDTGTNVADGRAFGNGTAGYQIRILNASKNFITNTTVENGGWDAIGDGSGHGTWTSAAVAANSANDTHDGIAPGAELLVLKALSDDGSGSTADIAAAIRYAADQNADVITMSLGSLVYDEEIVRAIEYAAEQGAIMTVAAGNSRQYRSPGIATPGDAEGVLTVGATTGDEPSHAKSAYFSQYGPDTGATDLSAGTSRGATIDVVAPGMKTVAQVPVERSGSRTRLSTLSGTSMATPMVAGGAALVVEAHPNWNATEVQNWIRDGARPIPAAAASEVGHGMAAVDNAISQTEPEQDQSDAMTDGASARDDFHRAIAGDAEGLFALSIRPAAGVA